MRPQVLIRSTALILSSVFCPSAHAADQLPLTITISGPRTVAVGDNIAIRVDVKNVSNRTIQFSTGKDYVLRFRDEYGGESSRKPGEWTTGCSGCDNYFDIEPGKGPLT